MLRQPGDICDAHIPDYDAGIMVTKSEEGAVVKSIASQIHRVLVIGASKCDFFCLPIVPVENAGSYLPVGSLGFTDPLKMHHVVSHQFHGYQKSLSAPDMEAIRVYVQGLYTLLIQKGCHEIHWANIPLAVFIQERFIMKRRPVVTIGYNLHLPLSTNGGRYRGCGPIIPFGNKPGQVGHIPVFSPDNFLDLDAGMLLSSKQKKAVHEHALNNLPNLFKPPE